MQSIWVPTELGTDKADLSQASRSESQKQLLEEPVSVK